MIDYKYPTIALGATPIGSAGRAPDEELLREDHQWRARKKNSSPLSVASASNKLDIYSHRESGFKNPMILAIAFEVKVIWSRRFQEVGELKSKIQEVKDWRNRRFQEVEVIWSQRLKHLKIEEFEVLETQPESATRIESQGLLTWICPLGTYGLVYRVRPVKKVYRNKDTTCWLGVEEGRL
jgi:hypothetical protein